MLHFNTFSESKSNIVLNSNINAENKNMIRIRKIVKISLEKIRKKKKTQVHDDMSKGLELIYSRKAIASN